MADLIVGIDEVGRGSWAGPLVVGAVMLKDGAKINELTDSKLLTKLSRSNLVDTIKQNSIFFGTGWVWPKEIDKIGLTEATALAAKRAIKNFLDYDLIIVDGSYNFLSDIPKTQSMVKADVHIPAVSAASVLAKVQRDEYMIKQSKIYPKYGFDKHVGYGTAEHRRVIEELGVCELHRLSYKPLLKYAAV